MKRIREVIKAIDWDGVVFVGILIGSALLALIALLFSLLSALQKKGLL